MASIKQHADGSLSVFSDTEQKSIWRAGGSANPATGGGDQTYRAPYTVKIPLNTTGTGTAALAAWQNTTGDNFLVGYTRVLNTTTTTGSFGVSVGVNTDATTSLCNNLIDNAQMKAAGVYDNIKDKGTNGFSSQLLINGNWVMVSTFGAGSSVNSFIGTLYLDVIKV